MAVQAHRDTFLSSFLFCILHFSFGSMWAQSSTNCRKPSSKCLYILSVRHFVGWQFDLTAVIHWTGCTGSIIGHRWQCVTVCFEKWENASYHSLDRLIPSLLPVKLSLFHRPSFYVDALNEFSHRWMDRWVICYHKEREGERTQIQPGERVWETIRNRLLHIVQTKLDKLLKRD